MMWGLSEFKCDKCGHIFAVVSSTWGPIYLNCPKCGEVSGIGFDQSCEITPERAQQLLANGAVTTTANPRNAGKWTSCAFCSEWYNINEVGVVCPTCGERLDPYEYGMEVGGRWSKIIIVAIPAILIPLVWWHWWGQWGFVAWFSLLALGISLVLANMAADVISDAVTINHNTRAWEHKRTTGSDVCAQCHGCDSKKAKTR